MNTLEQGMRLNKDWGKRMVKNRIIFFIGGVWIGLFISAVLLDLFVL